MSLEVSFCGVKFPNPFVLASAPPTTTGEMIMRAFDAGWGGAIIKTVGPLPGGDIVNPNPRFAALHAGRSRMWGFQNIELITDRPGAVWLEECRIIKDKYPDHVLIASIMAAGSAKEDWQELTVAFQETGVDMLELNLGCPHGMPERGMGSVCSQNPEITGNITKWVKEVAKIPVLVKLSPNVTDITVPGRAAADNGADGLTAINTVNVMIGVDIDTFEPLPSVAGLTTYGGYSGAAVRPMALKAISDLARKIPGMPLSATGGIATWRDAVEFLLVGAGTLQVCTEVMHHGFGVVGPMKRGLERYMAEHGFESLEQIIGLTVPKITDHSKLPLSHKPKAVIDASACIKCDLCYVACEDSGYQAISIPHARSSPVKDKSVPTVHVQLCTGCSLCQHVCPVDCIKLEQIEGAILDEGYKQLSVGPDATYPGAGRWKKEAAAEKVVV